MICTSYEYLPCIYHTFSAAVPGGSSLTHRVNTLFLSTLCWNFFCFCLMYRILTSAPVLLYRGTKERANVRKKEPSPEGDKYSGAVSYSEVPWYAPIAFRNMKRDWFYFSVCWCFFSDAPFLTFFCGAFLLWLKKKKTNVLDTVYLSLQLLYHTYARQLQMNSGVMSCPAACKHGHQKSESQGTGVKGILCIYSNVHIHVYVVLVESIILGTSTPQFYQHDEQGISQHDEHACYQISSFYAYDVPIASKFNRNKVLIVPTDSSA